jgi:hypothetical protein
MTFRVYLFFLKTMWRDGMPWPGASRHLAFIFPCSYFSTFSLPFLKKKKKKKKSLNVLE